MKNFSPMLFTDLKCYSKNQFLKDIISGIIVAVIALPLSIALAIASGVTPQMGIYTAIVAGFITSLLGGSSVQIAGPTAAFATIVAGIVAKSGLEGLAIATILAGIFLIIMGILKFGNLIKFIPYTITTGFTAGIAVTLVIGQLKDFFGVTYLHGEKPIETVEKTVAFLNNIGTLNIQALAIGLISLLILIFWPKLCKIIPASLIAVIAGIIIVKGFSLNVNTIGDLYKVTSSLPVFVVPDFTLITAVIPDAVTIAVLAGIESLLSCVVADGMIKKRHRSNTELIAQGFANIGSAMLGGIPATGAIARTAANIKNGGRTPVSGMVHSLVLLAVLLAFMKYAAFIPMPVIAAILIQVAYNMCQAKQFIYLIKTSPKSDIIVLVTTFILTVVFDLVVAIEIGVLVACVLFLKRMSDESKIESWTYNNSGGELMNVPSNINVYELSGPLFFAVAENINMIKVNKHIKAIVLRMRSVPSIDTDAIRCLTAFVTRCKKSGITVIMSHVNEQPQKAMIKSGLYNLIGEENFKSNIDLAMKRATEVAEQI